MPSGVHFVTLDSTNLTWTIRFMNRYLAIDESALVLGLNRPCRLAHFLHNTNKSQTVKGHHTMKSNSKQSSVVNVLKVASTLNTHRKHLKEKSVITEACHRPPWHHPPAENNPRSLNKMPPKRASNKLRTPKFQKVGAQKQMKFCQETFGHRTVGTIGMEFLGICFWDCCSLAIVGARGARRQRDYKPSPVPDLWFGPIPATKSTTPRPVVTSTVPYSGLGGHRPPYCTLLYSGVGGHRPPYPTGLGGHRPPYPTGLGGHRPPLPYWVRRPPTPPPPTLLYSGLGGTLLYSGLGGHRPPYRTHPTVCSVHTRPIKTYIKHLPV